MIRRVSICLVLLPIVCSPVSAWPLDLQLTSEHELADRPSRPWTYAELEAVVNHSLNGRSFAQGRQLFKLVKCVKCHRMDGEGNELGPDLAALDRQWTPTRILRHTLEPSLEINRAYRTHIFELESGEVISGLITAVGLNSVKVVENPLVKKQPKTIKTGTVQQRRLSRQSIMPTGLLDKLTQAEILDLLAYVYAGGNDRHSVFQDGAE